MFASITAWLKNWKYKKERKHNLGNLLLTMDMYDIPVKIKWHIISEMDKRLELGSLYIPDYKINLDKYPVLWYAINQYYKIQSRR